MKKVLICLFWLLLLAGSFLPFASPVYASSQDRVAEGEGSQTGGEYIGGSTNYTNTQSIDSTVLRFWGYSTTELHTWNMQDFSVSGCTIDSVTITWHYATEAYSGEWLCPYVRISGVNYQGTCYGGVGGLIYVTRTYTWEHNPSQTPGTDWTNSSLNNAEFGIVHYSTGYIADVDLVKITVNYTSNSAPAVETNDAEDVVCDEATMIGNITATGGATPDYRCFVWDTVSHSNPANTAPVDTDYNIAGDYWSESGTFSTGEFTHSQGGFSEGDTIYYRAGAHNSVSWAYGDEYSFELAYAPIIITEDATDISVTTARLQSYISDSGNMSCQVRWGYGLSDEGGNIESYDTFTSFSGSYSNGESPYLDISSLISGTTYYFNVEIQNDCGATTATSTSFQTESSVGSPSNVVAFPDYDNIELSWAKGTGASNTFIRRRTNVCPEDETDGTLVYFGRASTFIDTGLESGTDYCYYVVGYDIVEGYSSGYVTIHSTTLAEARTTTVTEPGLDKPGSGSTDAPSIADSLVTRIPLLRLTKSGADSIGMLHAYFLYAIMLIGLTGLSYAIYRWTHSIDLIVVIWVVASWIAYPLFGKSLIIAVTAIFVTLLGIGYGVYRARSVI